MEPVLYHKLKIIANEIPSNIEVEFEEKVIIQENLLYPTCRRKIRKAYVQTCTQNE